MFSRCGGNKCCEHNGESDVYTLTVPVLASATSKSSQEDVPELYDVEKDVDNKSDYASPRGWSAPYSVDTEAVRDFQARLSNGCPCNVLLEDGVKCPCMMWLKSRDDKTGLQVEADKEVFFVFLENIQAVTAGTDLGGFEIPIPMHDLCGTVIMEQQKCMSFSFGSIDERDRFVDCLRFVVQESKGKLVNDIHRTPVKAQND